MNLILSIIYNNNQSGKQVFLIIRLAGHSAGNRHMELLSTGRFRIFVRTDFLSFG